MNRIMFSTTCASVDRFIDAYAAATNILTNQGGIEFVMNLNFLETESIDHYLGTLGALAHCRDSDFVVHKHSSDKSLAYMYHHMLECTDADYWISVDDDSLVPAITSNALIKHTEYGRSACLYGFYEVVNRRGYEDWDSYLHEPFDIGHTIKKATSLPQAKPYLHKHYVETEHNVAIDISNRGLSSGSFMVSAKSVKNNKEAMAKLESWPKGQRGVDVFICSLFDSDLEFLVVNAYHTDRTGSHLNNDLWTKDVPGKTWGNSDE